MKLSLIFPTLQDHQEIDATIRSIRATSGDKCEIIVVDDCSTPPVQLEDKNVILIRNSVRVGAGGSKHIGAVASTGDYIFLGDCHLRFEPGWYEKVMARIVGRETTVHCGSCVGLDTNDMHMEEYARQIPWSDVQPGRRVTFDKQYVRKLDDERYSVMESSGPVVYDIDKKDRLVTLQASSRYYGAMLNLFGPNPGNIGEHQVFEGVWACQKPHNMPPFMATRTDWYRPDEDDYEISSLMGACYFFPRKWYFHIGGMSGNKIWGSEEPFLSLKTYLAGGSIRIMKNVRIGHKFHSGKIPYKLVVYWKHYNKMRSIMTTMNQCESQFLFSKLAGEVDINQALEQINADRKEIMEEAAYLKTVLVHDMEWFCQKFGIKHFLQ